MSRRTTWETARVWAALQQEDGAVPSRISPRCPPRGSRLGLGSVPAQSRADSYITIAGVDASIPGAQPAPSGEQHRSTSGSQKPISALWGGSRGGKGAGTLLRAPSALTARSGRKLSVVFPLLVCPEETSTVPPWCTARNKGAFEPWKKSETHPPPTPTSALPQCPGLPQPPPPPPSGREVVPQISTGVERKNGLGEAARTPSEPFRKC